MSIRSVTLAGYVLIALIGSAWQTRCVRRHSLTFGRFLSWLTSRTAVSALLLMGWAWLGWHLFVRGSAAFLTP